jgi:integrase
MEAAMPAGRISLPESAGRRRLLYQLPQTCLAAALRDCGIDYEFHSLRHAAASLFIEQMQWSPKRIQTVMGHSSIVMTFDGHGHRFPQGDISEDLKRMEAAVLRA